jgi:type III restriction enzyme
MELKPYQQQVLDNLESYLEYCQQEQTVDAAFKQYWADKIGPYNPLTGAGMRPYQKNISNAAQVCIKVPTAGGKTFIACNALKTIFNAFPPDRPKAVVWLVPWSNLLEQTKNNLSNPEHPYRQKLNSLFNHKVAVYDKADLLQGANFNPTVVNEQLSIFVLGFASLRVNTRNKDDRKIYQENGQLAAFADLYPDRRHILSGTDETALINVIRWLNPVVVVDESHNAESELSVEMLKNVNPCFVLDLTATPKANSNIISFVNAIELKREHMVKLPVIIYNHHDKNEVISSALQMQRKLELLAKEEEETNGGKYIRPIVLFQAQPKTAADNTTFEKIKEKLLELKIPAEQIKIKTATINELSGLDLAAKDCPVRYIITVNALKEGWDCPFAYILASLANKASAVDVEQILGRILRQPYVAKHKSPLLNLAYVLTSSSKFQETLNNIVVGLQNAGFSDQDYREKNMVEEAQPAPQDPLEQLVLVATEPEETDTDDDIDTSKISYNPDAVDDNLDEGTVSEIENLALTQSQDFEKQIEQSSNNNPTNLPPELKGKVKMYPIKEDFRELAAKITLPQFYLSVPVNDLFNTGSGEVLLNRDALLEGFKLGNQDINLDFANISADLYKVDLEKTKKDTYVPALAKINEQHIKEPLIDYILARPKESQVQQLAGRMLGLIGDMYPIPDQEIRKYLARILEGMDTEQIRDFLSREYTWRDKIRKKIETLAEEYAENQFTKNLDVDKILVKPSYKFPESLVPGQLSAPITKSLYEREGAVNTFEERVILDIANLPNIAFWHRNLGRGKGFCINGFKSNHYPDFIVVTKSEKIVIIETKGDDRDNSDSAAKNRLGKAWANKAGSKYKYFMVFDNRSVEDTLTLDQLKDRIKEL